MLARVSRCRHFMGREAGLHESSGELPCRRPQAQAQAPLICLSPSGPSEGQASQADAGTLAPGAW